VCVCVCVCVYVYVCMCVCVYVCMCVSLPLIPLNISRFLQDHGQSLTKEFLLMGLNERPPHARVDTHTHTHSTRHTLNFDVRLPRITSIGKGV